MADKLELVRGYDFVPDQGTVSLLDYTDGFTVAYQGWIPQTIPDRDGLVTEALTLRARGTSINDLAANLQKLARKAEVVRDYYRNTGEQYGVWLRVQHEGETNVRQAFIAEMTHEAAASIYDEALRSINRINQYTLGIRRYPYWEAVTPGTITAASISNLGGTFSFSSIGGDVPARIAELMAIDKPTDPPVYNQMNKPRMWIGFRTNRFGDPSKFVPFWGFGSALYPYPYPYDPNPIFVAGVIQGAGSYVADSKAIYGKRLEYLYTGTAIAPQNVHIGGVGAMAVTTDPNEQAGEYIAVLRARLPTAGTYLVQLRTGYRNEIATFGTYTVGNYIFPNGQIYPRISVTNTIGTANQWYQLWELGRITIPSPNKQNRFGTDLHEFTLNLYCEKLSGTCAIHVDGIFLIPTEGLVSVLTEGTVAVNRFNGTLHVSESPDGLKTGAVTGYMDWSTYGAGTLNSYYTTGIPHIDYGVPAGVPGIGVLVFGDADEAMGVNQLTDTKDLVIRYVERWNDMRGNDG